MAKLFFTTETFRPMGSNVPGVPMILDREMRLVEPACSWLMHLALVRGRTRSRETWRTYAETLFDWWQTIEANDWKWDRVGPLHVAAYRDRMLCGLSDLTGRPYARSTVNARLRILALFYSWCRANGLCARVPFTTSLVRVSRDRSALFLAHVDASAGIVTANELTVRHTRDLPRALPTTTLRMLLVGLSARDRLLVEWALYTGMRRIEVAALRIPQLATTSSEETMPAIRLVITKGMRPRTVYPPRPLLERTRAYVREERSVVIKRAKQRDDYQPTENVFLKRDGSAVTARNVGAMFADAAQRAHVTATFHALRHTFACTMLKALQAQKGSDLNPLLTLQLMLGHSSIATTSIYLRVLGDDLAVVERSIDHLYETML